jgi:toxin ParE1/3/4
VPTIFKRAAARRDLIERYVYLAENAGETIADRFLQRAQQTFDELLAQPHTGKPLTLQAPELAGLRQWRVRDFEKVLIFYLPHSEGISIVRVLYAAQDWWGALGIL